MSEPHSPASPSTPPLDWQHRLTQLGPQFFTRLQPTPLAAPAWAARNHALASELGWSALLDDAHLSALAGNALLVGSDPLATVYSGHQFGHWAGQLGDGRAIWLGEAASALGLQEIQLKGAGPTPYSRRGDGRAVLRSSIREYLCSEAMHGLGIPTTRALSLVASPEPVRRETLESAAIVARIAPSFLRFGHVEHFAARDQIGPLRELAEHAIRHHLPEALVRAERWQGQAHAGLLDEWQAVGFCHGVMNTDNMSLLGLTLDYGPFQFLDGYDPLHICNHSDSQGRYAYGRQPQIAHWNLYRLGQALLPLIGDRELTLQVLEGYGPAFARALGDALRAKLGLVGADAPEARREDDMALADDLLQLLARERVDHTIFWRRLSQAMAAENAAAGAPWALGAPHWQSLRDLLLDRPALDAWLQRYRARCADTPAAALGARMLRTNPHYVLRNHLAETAIQQAQAGDFSEVERLLALLQSPFDEREGMAAYADFPPDWASDLEISCSS